MFQLLNIAGDLAFVSARAEERAISNQGHIASFFSQTGFEIPAVTITRLDYTGDPVPTSTEKIYSRFGPRTAIYGRDRVLDYTLPSLSCGRKHFLDALGYGQV